MQRFNKMMSLRWWEELLSASSCWGWEMGDERAAVRTLSSVQCRSTGVQSAIHVHCSAFWWAGAHAGVRSMCELLAWLCDILPRSSAYRVCPVASQEEAVRGWKMWFMRSNDFSCEAPSSAFRKLNPAACRLNTGHPWLPECSRQGCHNMRLTLMAVYLV